jgi:hypothetical protein
MVNPIIPLGEMSLSWTSVGPADGLNNVSNVGRKAAIFIKPKREYVHIRSDSSMGVLSFVGRLAHWPLAA